MRPPSTALLGAILRPVTKCRAQTRASSNGHNVSLLDKLHRKQKEAIRQERALLSASDFPHTCSLNRQQVSPQSSALNQTQSSPRNLQPLQKPRPRPLTHPMVPSNHLHHHRISPTQSPAPALAANYQSTTSRKAAVLSTSPGYGNCPAT